MKKTFGPHKERLVGWQIVDGDTDDPPPGMHTYEIYTLNFVLDWLADPEVDRSYWRLIPIFDGDVEEPVFK